MNTNLQTLIKVYVSWSTERDQISSPIMISWASSLRSHISNILIKAADQVLGISGTSFRDWVRVSVPASLTTPGPCLSFTPSSHPCCCFICCGFIVVADTLMCYPRVVWTCLVHFEDSRRLAIFTFSLVANRLEIANGLVVYKSFYFFTHLKPKMTTLSDALPVSFS